MEQLLKALLVARKTFKPIPKDKTANIPTKTGGKYSYKYSDLSTILDCVQTPLSEQGLQVVSFITYVEGKPYLETSLFHITGQALKTVYALPVDVSDQEIGSAITYGRRYSICSLLNLAADEDDDGALASQAKVKSPVPSKVVVPSVKPLGAQCTLCNTVLQLSKSGAGYYCPNFKDGKGEHTRLKSQDLQAFINNHAESDVPMGFTEPGSQG